MVNRHGRGQCTYINLTTHDTSLTRFSPSMGNSGKNRCPTVKWSGIQNTLEESRSDVLILLDCCASGVCTTDEGNGVTELVAACAYNAIANGVGPFSFTHALTIKLRTMVSLPYFTVAYLYNSIFTEVQSQKHEDSRYKKAPVHLVLTQNLNYPRSIRLSPKRKTNTVQRTVTEEQSKIPTTPSASDYVSQSKGLQPSTEPSSIPSSGVRSGSNLSHDSSPPSSMSSMSPLPIYPRLLFSVRVTEDVRGDDLCTELFADWLRQIPVATSLVRVEAGFASDSTILLCSGTGSDHKLPDEASGHHSLRDYQISEHTQASRIRDIRQQAYRKLNAPNCNVAQPQQHI